MHPHLVIPAYFKTTAKFIIGAVLGLILLGVLLALHEMLSVESRLFFLPGFDGYTVVAVLFYTVFAGLALLCILLITQGFLKKSLGRISFWIAFALPLVLALYFALFF